MTEQIDDKVNEPPDAGAKGEGKTSELLPCPFCGGEATLIYDQSSDYKNHWSYIVECTAWRKNNPCGGDFNYKSKAEAITAWNRRSDAALAASRQECERLKADSQNFMNNLSQMICGDCDIHLPEAQALSFIEFQQSLYAKCAGCLMDECERLRETHSRLLVKAAKIEQQRDDYLRHLKSLVAAIPATKHLSIFQVQIDAAMDWIGQAESQLTAALAERDKARAEALEEAANAAIEVVDDWIENLSAAAFDDKYNHLPDESIGDVIRRHISTKLSTVGATGEKNKC